MSLRDLLNVLFKRKLIILGFLLAALAGGYAGLKLIPPSYAATARLLVRIGPEDIYSPVLPSSQFREPMLAIVREEQLRSEASILASPDLTRRVVEDLTPQVLFPGIDVRHPWYSPRGMLQQAIGVYRALEGYFFPLSRERTLLDQASSRFQRNLRIDAINTSNIIEVTLRGRVPTAAVLGVNHLIGQYLEARGEIHQREQTEFFTDQLAALESQLQETEAAVDKFRRDGQIVDLDLQRGARLERLEEVRKRIDEHRVAIAEAERRNQVLTEQLATVPATTQLVGAETANSIAISEMGKQLADLRRREADIATRFNPQDPRLGPLREEIAAVEAMLQRLQKSRDASTEEGINPLHARIRDDLMQGESLIASLREAAQHWRELEQDLAGGIDELNTQEASYKRLVQQVEVLRETRQLYLEKVEETRLMAAQAAARIGNVSVINLASPDHRPVSPRLWLVLAGVLFVGVAGGLGLAFVLEFFDDSLRSDTDVQDYLQLPVLAKVPDLPLNRLPPPLSPSSPSGL